MLTHTCLARLRCEVPSPALLSSCQTFGGSGESREHSREGGGPSSLSPRARVWEKAMGLSLIHSSTLSCRHWLGTAESERSQTSSRPRGASLLRGEQTHPQTVGENLSRTTVHGKSEISPQAQLRFHTARPEWLSPAPGSSPEREARSPAVQAPGRAPQCDPNAWKRRESAEFPEPFPQSGQRDLRLPFGGASPEQVPEGRREAYWNVPLGHASRVLRHHQLPAGRPAGQTRDRHQARCGGRVWPEGGNVCAEP